jgi:vacuolar-type H+-ATPase subunit H
MKEIVDQILKEEEATRSRLEQAQSQAHDMVVRAHTQAAAASEAAAAELRTSAEKSRSEAEQGFRAEKEQILAGTKNEAVNLREKRSRDIPQFIQQIFNQIIEIKP